MTIAVSRKMPDFPVKTHRDAKTCKGGAK